MYEYKWNTVPTMERTILCLHIKADQFYYPHGVRRGGYLNSLMASLENMWKACQKVRMCWIILVTALRLALVDVPIFTDLVGRCDG